MRVLFVLPAASIYDVQGRVAGWRHTPCDRASLKQLKALVPRLQELGVTRIIAGDLDEQSAKALSNKLKVPCELWQSLRRFNWGKHHGMKQEQADKLMKELRTQWTTNPEIPIHGGDSLASHRKRLNGARERLATVPHPPVVVVINSTTAQELFGLSTPLEHNRIYEVSLCPSQSRN